MFYAAMGIPLYIDPNYVIPADGHSVIMHYEFAYSHNVLRLYIYTVTVQCHVCNYTMIVTCTMLCIIISVHIIVL